MMEVIRFAVLGVGHIGRRHMAIIQGHPETELVGLADIRSSQIVDQGDGVIPYFSDLTSLLTEGPPFDVLCICTPNGLHAEHALQALRAHKHVVIEKPMALSRADCEKVIHESLRCNRQVFCVMQNRYSPPITWLKSVIEEGLLGRIQLVQINCFWNRSDQYYLQNDGTPHTWHGTKSLDGGVLFTQFAHFIDILYWLLGDIEVIRTDMQNVAHQHNTEFDDSGNVIFRLIQGGGLGNLCFSTAAFRQNFESTITLIGENGTIKIGGQYMNQVEHCLIQGYEMPELPASNPPNDYGPYQGSAANHHYVIQNVVDVLRGYGSMTTNAMEGMKVVEMIEKIYAACTNR